MFTVESGVAIPKQKRNTAGLRPRARKFPIMEMEVGDSFFAGGYVPTKNGPKPPHFKFFQTSNLTRQRPGTKWTLRTVTESGVLGVRVWRVK